MITDAIQPDFSDAVEFDDSQVPPGVYKVRIDSFEKKTTAANQKRVLWKVVIFGADGEMVRQNNRPLYISTMLEGPGTGILKALLQAIGYTYGPGFAGKKPLDWPEGWQNAALGKELQVTATKNIKPDGTEGFPSVRSITAIKQ